MPSGRCRAGRLVRRDTTQPTANRGYTLRKSLPSSHFRRCERRSSCRTNSPQELSNAGVAVAAGRMMRGRRDRAPTCGE